MLLCQLKAEDARLPVREVLQVHDITQDEHGSQGEPSQGDKAQVLCRLVGIS